jgi:type VI secretion system protein ImpL
VYFTSGTQEGTPIDRLLGSLGRRFAVAADAVRASGSRGKAYFIERLLKEVVIPESGLAGLNRRLEMRKAALQLGAYAAIAALTVAGVIFMSVSYARGQGYIDRVQEALDTAARTGEIAPDSPRAAVVRRLDALRGVTEVGGEPYAPWYARWGLYQGRAIGEAARDAYIREMNAALLPRIRTSLEHRIQAAPEPEDLYEYLKGYLMLGEDDVARADADPLAYLDWDEPGAGDALSQHLLRLIESKQRMRPVALDEVVVRQARSTIRNASIPQLVYRTVIRAYEGDEARALRLDIESGIGAAQVLRFRSGRPLTQPVSSLYTKPVFQEVAGPEALEEVVNKYATELWVWGEAGAPETSYGAVRTAVLDLYESDYIAQWDGILNDLEVVSMPTLRSLKEGLNVLAGPKSPLRGLLTVVDRHTYLVEEKNPEEDSGLIDGVIKRIPLPGASRETTRPPGSRVTEHFAAIHRAVTGPPGSAPIDATLETLGRIRDTLATTGDAVGEKPADPATQLTTRDLARTLEAGAEQLPSTASSISRQVARAAVAVVSRGASDSFERLYQERVLRECEAVTRGFYPFMPSSPNDVPLADFAALFGYGGVFDRFFTEELQKYADATATSWRWRPQSPVRSSALLRQFERADRIRRTFFTPGSRDVQLEFRLQITDASSERFVLEIDGQTFDFRHFERDPETVRWPGTGAGMAIATFHHRGGRTERLPDRPFEGAWAWFRLLDAASVQAEGSVTSRYALRFSSGANWATARVDALRVRNPFGDRSDLRGFSCSL